MIKIFLGVGITVNFRRIAATLDVDQQRGVLHSVLHPRGFPGVGVRLEFSQYNYSIMDRGGQGWFLLETF